MLRTEQRSRSIIHQFVRDSSDPASYTTNTVIYTRIYDVPSNIATLTELDPTLPHSWLDSDTFQITTAERGHAIRFTRYLELENYWDTSIRNVVRGRVANHYIDSADRLAINEYLTAEASYTDYAHYGPPGSSATGRDDLAATDIANSDMVDAGMIALEARDVAESFSDPGGIFMLCHPFVLADIAREDEDYVTAALYEGAARRFRGFRPPLWNGVVPIVSTKMVLPNAGDSTDGTQTTLNGAANGASTAGGVTSFDVTSAAGFSAGDLVSIHPAGDGTEVLNTSEELEHVKIASIATNTITVERPLSLDHASGAYFTKTTDLFPVIFVGADFEGGETVIRGITDPVTVYSFAGPSFTDPVGRYTAVAWYGIFGYDLVSPWNMELYILRSNQTAVLRRQL
jgi:hypothetical protein